MATKLIRVNVTEYNMCKGVPLTCPGVIWMENVDGKIMSGSSTPSYPIDFRQVLRRALAGKRRSGSYGKYSWTATTVRGKYMVAK